MHIVQAHQETERAVRSRGDGLLAMPARMSRLWAWAPRRATLARRNRAWVWVSARGIRLWRWLTRRPSTSGGERGVKPPTKRGAPKGHPGWGGRPRGVTMPCGWKCGAELTAALIRTHFKTCPKRP